MYKQWKPHKYYSHFTPYETLSSIFSHVLGKTYSDYKVFLFGSRAKGDAKPGSDRDIGIIGKTKLPRHIIRELQDICEESPYNVDIIDFTDLHSDFAKHAILHTKPLI